MPPIGKSSSLGDASESPLTFYLRWVAKIALTVGVMAAAGLTVALFVATDGSGATYGELVQSHTITQRLLAPALLISGLFLLALTAVLTWLVSLYSSFRIAGPLFRLTKNLEASIADGPGRALPIRTTDRLHAEAQLLDASLHAVARHLAAIDAELARQPLDVPATDRAQRSLQLAACRRVKALLDDAPG
jgi:hypothetical protein